MFCEVAQELGIYFIYNTRASVFVRVVRAHACIFKFVYTDKRFTFKVMIFCKYFNNLLVISIRVD